MDKYIIKHGRNIEEEAFTFYLCIQTITHQHSHKNSKGERFCHVSFLAFFLGRETRVGAFAMIFPAYQQKNMCCCCLVNI
jgi:hypothetical protein